MATTVALTGATGFIGAAVVREFHAAGVRVVLLLRHDSDTTRLLDAGDFDTVVYERLLDDSVVRDLEKYAPDAFIHCAWRGVAGRERNEAFQVIDNIPFTLDAVELAGISGCRQWIGLGSQAEYGNPNRRTSEDDPVVPTTVYGKAKLAAGIGALALCEARGIAGAWLRVFSTYGPGDAPHWLLPYIIDEFLAGRAPELTACEQLWDYLYVDDAARAIAAVARSRAHGVFNLGSGTALPLKHYVEAVRTAIDPRILPRYGAVPYRPDQVMHLQADVSRLQAQTDWRPQTALVHGIAATVAAARANQRLESTQI